MRLIAVGGCLALLIACARSEQRAAQDSTAAIAVGAPTQLTLGELAGQWTIEARSTGTDSLLLTYEMVAAADPAGWTFTLPSASPVPYRVVTADGDSVVLEAGPYQSALRKGVEVTTRSVLRLEGGELAGVTVAHYTTSEPDSVLTAVLHGTRSQ